MTRLVDADMVAADWNKNAHKGMVTDSVVVFVVREGNPENIQTWDDLLRDGVEVITPNPFTSGGAQWNIMAAYGAQLEQGKSEEEGIQYLKDLFVDHVPVQDKSAREALQTFAGGKGDVMLAYENEAIFAKNQGQPLDYVVPDETILIENPVAATSISKNAETAQAFVDYLWTPEAQRIFGEQRLPARRRGRPGRVRLPGAVRALHDRRRGRLARREEALLRPRGLDLPRHRERAGSPD